MVKNSIISRLMICCLMLWVLASCKPKEVKLELTFKKNDDFKIKMIITQEISQTMMGQEIKTNQTIGNVYHYHVENSDQAGIYDVKTTYDSMFIEQESPMGSLKFDSKAKEKPDNPLSAVYSSIVGKSFKIKMNNMGKVLEVNGLKEILDEATKSITNSSEDQSKAVTAGIRQQFSEDSIRDMMENMTAVYPDKNVRPGDSWERISSLSIGFPLIIKTGYTLEKIEANGYLIKFKSKMHTDPDQKPIETGPIKSNYSLEGEQTGQMRLDKVTGFLLSGNALQEMDGEIKMLGSAQMPGGMTVPLKIKSNTSWERIK